jgi:alanine dehydrogenase
LLRKAIIHLAPDPVQTQELAESGATGIASETVTGPSGDCRFCTDVPGGRMSIQAGATRLEAPHGGGGLLLAGEGIKLIRSVQCEEPYAVISFSD